MCGADWVFMRTISAVRGSSPRVRGRPAVRDAPGEDAGLIPACAGQTELAVVEDLPVGAHPRVCGADSRNTHPGGDACGSSPRVRGRRARIFLIAWPRVGSSPRVRGRLRSSGIGQNPVGSSPRVRGRPPARRWSRSTRTAHPRVCGADVPYAGPIHWGWGSSPRVRGRHLATSDVA